MEVEHCEHGVWIALTAVALDSGADEGLGKDKVREVMQRQELRVARKQLRREALEREVVDLRIWVEELKVDIDETLLACKKMSGC